KSPLVVAASLFGPLPCAQSTAHCCESLNYLRRESRLAPRAASADQNCTTGEMGEGQGCKKVKVQNSRAAAVVVLVQITEIGYRAVGHSPSTRCMILGKDH